HPAEGYASLHPQLLGAIAPTELCIGRSTTGARSRVWRSPCDRSARQRGISTGSFVNLLWHHSWSSRRAPRGAISHPAKGHRDLKAALRNPATWEIPHVRSG